MEKRFDILDKNKRRCKEIKDNVRSALPIVVALLAMCKVIHFRRLKSIKMKSQKVKFQFK